MNDVFSDEILSDEAGNPNRSKGGDVSHLPCGRGIHKTSL